MSHEHCHCEHELKYCANCDAVSCAKCKKEWKKEVLYNTVYGSSQTTPGISPWAGAGGVTYYCSHS